MGAETIRVRRGGGQDDFGNPVPKEIVGEYHGCDVYPRTSSEERFSASTVIVGYGAIIPDPTADITAQDEVEWARFPDRWMGVEGQPGPWFFGDGSPGGLQLALRGGQG